MIITITADVQAAYSWPHLLQQVKAHTPTAGSRRKQAAISCSLEAYRWCHNFGPGRLDMGHTAAAVAGKDLLEEVVVGAAACSSISLALFAFLFASQDPHFFPVDLAQTS